MAGPLYREIADDLRRRIESGELGEGGKLPTEDELMEAFTASRNTVRGAIKELSTRGFVYTHHGKGTFVTERVEPHITTLSEDPDTGFGGDERISDLAGEPRGQPSEASSPRVEILLARDQTAAALHVAVGASVVSRFQQRYINGRPWSMQASFYPLHLVEQGAARLIQAIDIGEGVLKYLDGTLGIRQAGYRDLIAVRTPNEDETAFFNLPADGRVDVVEVSRTAFDQEGNPFRLTVSVYRADRNQFAVNVGKVPSNEKDPEGGGRRDAQDHARE